MAFLYNATSGEKLDIKAANGKDFRPEQLIRLIGNECKYFECMFVSIAGEGRFFVFDEEGALRNLPINKSASLLAKQQLKGNVVSIKQEDLW
jgi:hypothetical protein